MYNNLNYIKNTLLSELKKLSIDIKEVINRRKITSVIHFTRVENLDAILTNGVIPRSSLQIGSFVFNDDIRADGKLGYSSFSISFPNHLMFYRLRNKSTNSKWAILVFNANVLSDFPCLFYPVNAASSTVSRLPLENFKGGKALEEMFTHAKDSRESFLLEEDPTDVQAEVMVPERVPMTYLKGCVLHDTNLVNDYSNKYPTIKFIHCHEGRRLFNTRRAFRSGF
ncbi:DarT ssDNA thymidine ADP-ribosyltransferase family protein [Acinetobacter nosocomialis]|uniref:DarT ssDNA thymidine ADP-ribosyltransferase family protein n=1 Tax=Acinetobacter nosocomialis TaxID=106654 RepID=UPI0029DBBE70|nr:DarT ssDNA thymidine ADP-ribosyltransferase family protein [Acinetobacter nosocomialis]MDX7881755.1 DarT ssDNA thymidine ADP-ribosyltransferase family protein [Acinetobacter nosocomialis]